MKYLFGTKEKNPNWKGGLPKCMDCGKQLVGYYSKRCVRCASIESNSRLEVRAKISATMTGMPSNTKGLKMSEESNRKRSEALRGEKSHLWRGGITPIYHAIRNSVEMRIWRRRVFERDNFICQNCGERGGRIHADHIKPFALYPELRFKVENGRTLCIPCHQATPTWGTNTKMVLDARLRTEEMKGY